MRIYISLLSLLSFVVALMLTPMVSAIPYPSTTPSGEVGSGTFNGYFTNMFNTSGCSGGDVVRGFSPTGILLCTAGGSGTGAEAPIGTISAFNLASCPSGWSPADGTGGNPDLRGEFIRGWDNGRGVDTGRVLASTQADMFRSHIHPLSSDTARFPGPTNIFMAGDGTAGGTTGGSTQATGGSETRPRNVALLYCVKTSAGTPANNTTWGLSGANVIQASTGSVGIGTASPGAKLEIAGTQDNLLRLNKTSGTTYNYMEWLIGGVRKYWTGIDAAGIFNIQSDSPYTAVAINAAGGNVGIGTASPKAKLQVGNIGWGYNPGATFHVESPNKAMYIANANQGQATSAVTINTQGPNYGVPAVEGLYTGNNIALELNPWAGGEVEMVFGNGDESNRMKIARPISPSLRLGFGTPSSEFLSILSSGDIGIGTATPGAKLEVAGNIKIVDGTQGAGKVLTSDASGLASWQSAGSTGWGLTGNAGTVAGTNYIGTTDNIDVVFKRNNIEGMRLSGASGNLVTTVDATINGVKVGLGGGNIASNTANGYRTLSVNTTGGWNTANGYEALRSNTTGNSNTANGHSALQSNTTGYNNTANGVQALRFNTTGMANTANGINALLFNTTGEGNTANGNSALSSNTTGVFNTANGYQALYFNTTSNSNTANGYQALRSNTTGNSNTALGYSAGSDISTGSSNIAIGSNAQVASNTASNQLSIGNWIYGTSGNIGIGVASPVSKLQVDGEIVSSNLGAGGQFRAAYGNYGSFIRNDGSNTYFLLTASGTPYGGWNGYRPIAIGNADSMVALNQSLYSLASGNVGIGTTTPGAKLDIAGNIKIVDGTQGAGKVLTSDAAGLASWITPGAASSTNFVNSLDGDRSAATKIPTTSVRGVRFDFVNASTTNGGGNYSGLMTYAPWDGTSASTGDASYQIGFNSPGTNASGVPYLTIRNGINSTWNSWYTMLNSGNYNAYSPTLTGVGASGIWPIAITGNAATATTAINASNVPWTGITGSPAFAANNVTGRVRMFEVGCESGYGSSCDANTNGRVDLSDSTTLAANSTLAGGINPSNFHRNDAAGDWQMASATNSSSYSNAALEVRELNFAGAQSAVVSEAPRVSFHWAGRVASQIGMGSDGAIRTFDNPGTGYENFAAKNIVANGTLQITGGAPGAGKVLTSDASGLASWQTATSSVTWAGVTAKSLGDTARVDSTLDIGTSQYMRWKNYGNGHVIIDASASTSPAGGAISNTDSSAPWSASYPTLMGWNGGSTYGVRVDSARVADGSAGTTSSRFFMPDTDESAGGPKSIHANSNVMGFLNGYGSWMVYWDTNGGQNNMGNINANGSITGNEIYNNGWFRSNGNAGWYSQSYGGGWWMSDPTWIRSYGGKYMYVDSIIQAGAYMNSPAYYYISDARLKKDLVKITSSLDKVTAMNGYYFKWKKDDKKDLGLIAQEVEKIFPDAVGEYTDPDSKKTYKNVEYGHLIAPVIEAIKELATLVKSNKADMVALRSENESLKKRLDAIEAKLSK